MLYWHRPIIRYRMRRVVVIFLILLFPLNVLALSHSVATAGSGAAPLLAAPEGQAHPVAIAAMADTGIDTASELDPDEPPAGMDLHDIVDLDPGLRLAALREAGAAPHAARRPCHALSPPLRPPRAS